MKKNSKLPACPFCGRKDMAKLVSSRDMMLCDCYPPDYKEWTVVCDAQRNGCGATCGYAPTRALAIAKWSTRAPARAEGGKA